jgi:hypothetical protein
MPRIRPVAITAGKRSGPEPTGTNAEREEMSTTLSEASLRASSARLRAAGPAATPQAQDSARAVATYRRALLVSIVLNLIVAVFILFWPSSFAELLGQPQPHPTTWPSHWGAQLLAINLLYLPGYWDPIRNRWPNYMGIAIRILFALFFFTQGDGFIWMGLYDGFFGILLWVTYRRARQADLMSKP